MNRLPFAVALIALVAVGCDLPRPTPSPRSLDEAAPLAAQASPAPEAAEPIPPNPYADGQEPEAPIRWVHGSGYEADKFARAVAEEFPVIAIRTETEPGGATVWISEGEDDGHYHAAVCHHAGRRVGLSEAVGSGKTKCALCGGKPTRHATVVTRTPGVAWTPPRFQQATGFWLVMGKATGGEWVRLLAFIDADREWAVRELRIGREVLRSNPVPVTLADRLRSEAATPAVTDGVGTAGPL